jgi:hypothetical protein
MFNLARAGRAEPSAAILDSQTIKAPVPGGRRGFDSAKKIVGHKRHISGDTGGRLLMVNLTEGDIADSAGTGCHGRSAEALYPPGDGRLSLKG